MDKTDSWSSLQRYDYIGKYLSNNSLFIFFSLTELILISNFTIVLDAKCDSSLLIESVRNIEKDINYTTENIQIISNAKTNLRKLIDCKRNLNFTRIELFTHYEAISKRKIILENNEMDLKIKKNVFEAEQKRCEDRCTYFLSFVFVCWFLLVFVGFFALKSLLFI